MQHLHGFLHCNELTKTNQNITIGSKNVGWVRSFSFWPETVRRFVNDLNRCIKCNPGMVFCTVTKLTKTNQNITIGSKNVDWVRSFRFWPGTMRRFVNGLNRCIKCNPGMVFCTVPKLTKTKPKHHYRVQKRGLVAFVAFLAQNCALFHSRLEWVHQMQHLHGFLHSNE